MKRKASNAFDLCSHDPRARGDSFLTAKSRLCTPRCQNAQPKQRWALCESEGVFMADHTSAVIILCVVDADTCALLACGAYASPFHETVSAMTRLGVQIEAQERARQILQTGRIIAPHWIQPTQLCLEVFERVCSAIQSTFKQVANGCAVAALQIIGAPRTDAGTEARLRACLADVRTAWNGTPYCALHVPSVCTSSGSDTVSGDEGMHAQHSANSLSPLAVSSRGNGAGVGALHWQDIATVVKSRTGIGASARVVSGRPDEVLPARVSQPDVPDMQDDVHGNSEDEYPGEDCTCALGQQALEPVRPASTSTPEDAAQRRMRGEFISVESGQGTGASRVCSPFDIRDSRASSGSFTTVPCMPTATFAGNPFTTPSPRVWFPQMHWSTGQSGLPLCTMADEDL